MNGTQLLTRKSDVRREARVTRSVSRCGYASIRAADELYEVLAKTPRTEPISGYMAIGTEIDPMPAMERLATGGHRVCVPVIQGKGQPLIFREWTPSSALIEGDFGALIPRGGEILEPTTLVVPLLAYDASGNRMGYGGGFNDRTLALLRERRPTRAIGFAFAAQEMHSLPAEPTDEPLDDIVTENGLHSFP